MSRESCYARNELRCFIRQAPIAVLRKRHRFRLAAKAPRSADLQGFLPALLAAAPPPRGWVRVAIDVDPQSFM